MNKIILCFMVLTVKILLLIMSVLISNSKPLDGKLLELSDKYVHDGMDFIELINPENTKENDIIN